MSTTYRNWAARRSICSPSFRPSRRAAERQAGRPTVKRLLAFFAVLSMATVLAGCAYPIPHDAVVETSRPTYDWKSLPSGELPDTLVIVTMSGGGTRATALAMSVLRAMDKIKLASGASLADEIDIVSSVSGGSVTAGYFAL